MRKTGSGINMTLIGEIHKDNNDPKGIRKNIRCKA